MGATLAANAVLRGKPQVEMALASGDRFGIYEIIELIGAGGMGEVYRARDSRLGRDVALKIVSEQTGLEHGASERLEREARLLASLNHPNIATLHGLETSGRVHALIMELVDGETLAEHLAGKPLPLEDAVGIARQIADALDAAHERGIVHRDLKPANVKMRPDGTVKVLDFGIASVFEASTKAHRGETIGISALHEAVVGTPSYMSPEQASGTAVDRRTDIWSFGCVLYEMLAAHRAFDGDSVSGVLARVLEREPDWTKLPATVPPALALLTKQCLEKNPRSRRRDAGDVRQDLENAFAERPAAPARGVSRRAGLWAAGVAALGFVAGVQLSRELATQPPSAALEPVRFEVSAPERGQFATSLFAGSGAPVGGSISPDGKKLAFTARGATNEIMLWVRPIGALDARALPGTNDAALPFWSPDGETLGFFAKGALKRIAAAGDEAPRVLAEIERGQGGTWSTNGTIVFAGGLRSGLVRVDEDGGETIPALTLAPGHTAYRFPHFLPGGKQFLYHVDAPRPEDAGVYLAELDDDSAAAAAGERLLAADSAAVYAPPGLLVFVRHGTLFAQAFDAATRALVAEPAPIADAISAEGAAPAFSTSTNGVLTYRAGPADSDRQQLVWFDRAGHRLEAVGPPGTYRGVDISPDGLRIAVHDHRGAGGDIWVVEPRGIATRVTFDPTHDNNGPVWSPDGSRIAFGSVRDGRWGIYHAAASGAGDEVLIAASRSPTIPASWAPDGAYLVTWLYEDGAQQWLQPLTGESRDARPLFAGRTGETHSQVSPDGQWIAYMTTATGRAEVFVRTFPGGDGPAQVSTSGGLTPRWRADGKELFYLTAPDQGQLMAVSFDLVGGAPAIGTPRPLFGVDMAIVPHSNAVQNFHPYDVSPDGERFVFPLPVSALSEDDAARITVVVDWPALLER